MKIKINRQLGKLFKNVHYYGRQLITEIFASCLVFLKVFELSRVLIQDIYNGLKVIEKCRLLKFHATYHLTIKDDSMMNKFFCVDFI